MPLCGFGTTHLVVHVRGKSQASRCQTSPEEYMVCHTNANAHTTFTTMFILVVMLRMTCCRLEPRRREERIEPVRLAA